MLSTVDRGAQSRTVIDKLPPSRGLRVVWILAFGSLALAFPIYTFLVFYCNLDRRLMADLMSVQVTCAYFIGMSAAMLPLSSLRAWTPFQRLQGVVLPFITASYITHLTWELGWIALHRPISSARERPWAYAWWAYIDGGDDRYLNPDAHFLMIEVLSTINGCVGIAGLILLKRSKFLDPRGTLLVMSTGVTHTVLTWYYYGSEVIAGFPSVNTSSVIDLGVKFILLNAPWLVFPWFVMYWGYLLLKRQCASHGSKLGEPYVN